MSRGAVLLVALLCGTVTGFSTRPAYASRQQQQQQHMTTTRTSRWAVGGQAYDHALLFDCDGVILETEELHRLAYNAAFDAFGLTIDGEPVNWSVRTR